MILRFVIFVAFMFCSGVSAGREIQHSLRLKQGQTEVTVKGRIPSPSDSAVYEFAARAGQRVSIHLTPGPRLDAQAVLVMPGGTQEGPGAAVNVTLGESGTFRIRIIPRIGTSGTFQLQFKLF